MKQLRKFILESNFSRPFTHACLEAISLLEAVNYPRPEGLELAESV